MTTIAFIRHGVTDWNLERRAQGQSDIPLNDEGLMQAKALARRFEREQWDAIYSSDLQRARKTAETIGEVLRLDVTVDERIREVSFGLIEGTNEKERVAQWGPDWKERDMGGEPDASVTGRLESFLEDLIATHPDEKVVVVSHGALLNDLFRLLLDGNYERHHLLNTSVTIFEHAEKWELRLFNCSTHLSKQEDYRNE